MIRNYAREIGVKIKDSVQYRGVIGTVQACFRTALHPILDNQKIINYRERRFDRKFGVDTAGIILYEDLKLNGPSAAHSNHYQAAQPVLLEQAIIGLKINYSEYTFVDFGCGKGKALLLASSFPFKKIIGVELSPELAEIAAANLKKYTDRRQRCRTLEIFCTDAVNFTLPPTPMVCFFYNPFKEAILTKVLDNIEGSLNKHPRDLIIVYLYPEFERVFRDRGFLGNTRRKKWCCVYRSRDAGLNLKSEGSLK